MEKEELEKKESEEEELIKGEEEEELSDDELRERLDNLEEGLQITNINIINIGKAIDKIGEMVYDMINGKIKKKKKEGKKKSEGSNVEVKVDGE